MTRGKGNVGKARLIMDVYTKSSCKINKGSPHSREKPRFHSLKLLYRVSLCVRQHDTSWNKEHTVKCFGRRRGLLQVNIAWRTLHADNIHFNIIWQ